MIHDQHCHSKYSFDSTENLENYFKIASDKNIKYLVTTEHIEFDSVSNNMDWTVDFDELKKDLKENHKKYPNVTPLLGVEIGYRKDYLDKMHKTIESEPFDVVNMSIHDNGKYDYYLRSTFNQIGIDNMLNIYFENIIDALDNFTDFDVLSHFDYGFKTAYLMDNNVTIDRYEEHVRTIFRKLIKLGKALEINMKVQSRLNSTHLKTILDWYYQEGGTKLTFSSDSHDQIVYESYYELQKSYLQTIKDANFNFLCYYIKRKEYHYDI